MGKKLNGMLNLSRIPKEVMVKNKNGESVIWVDIVENKNGVDQYGNTHSVSIYNKATQQTIYLGNFKPVEFGQSAEQVSETESVFGSIPEAMERKREQNAQNMQNIQSDPDGSLPF